jgi:hypothetical protein
LVVESGEIAADGDEFAADVRDGPGDDVVDPFADDGPDLGESRPSTKRSASPPS